MQFPHRGRAHKEDKEDVVCVEVMNNRGVEDNPHSPES